MLPDGVLTNATECELPAARQETITESFEGERSPIFYSMTVISEKKKGKTTDQTMDFNDMLFMLLFSHSNDQIRLPRLPKPAVPGLMQQQSTMA